MIESLFVVPVNAGYSLRTYSFELLSKTHDRAENPHLNLRNISVVLSDYKQKNKLLGF